MSSINFPDNPSLNDTFTFSNNTWTWTGSRWELLPFSVQGVQGTQGLQGEHKTVVSETVPESPYSGLRWFNSAAGKEYIYFDNYWVQTGSSFAGNPGSTGSTGAQGLQGVAGAGAGSANQVIYKNNNNVTVGSNNLVFDGSNLGVGVSSPQFSIEASGAIVSRSPFFLGANTITENFTIPSGYNAMTIGPVSIPSGVVVSIPDNSAWAII